MMAIILEKDATRNRPQNISRNKTTQTKAHIHDRTGWITRRLKKRKHGWTGKAIIDFIHKPLLGANYLQRTRK